MKLLIIVFVCWRVQGLLKYSVYVYAGKPQEPILLLMHAHLSPRLGAQHMCLTTEIVWYRGTPETVLTMICLFDSFIQLKSQDTQDTQRDVHRLFISGFVTGMYVVFEEV